MVTPAKMYPTGTVTFLFTDIGGSTRLWESTPDAMRVALAQHNAIVQAAVQAHDGVVFKLVGDAVFSAFAAPASAIMAAVDAQRELNDHTWPAELGGLHVRMAIHTGAAAATDGDYFGPPLNRVARLLALAHPGQILVSRTTTMLAADALPASVLLRDLGVYRLKDLSEPETTAQVVAESLRSDFPPLASLDARPNNLPFEIATFIGRTEELVELDEQLRTKRLVTVVGTGGIGKTRLALQAAANAIDVFVDGAWFVEGASLGDPQLLLQEIAVVLNVREEPQRSLDDTLAAAIGFKKTLVILDGVDRFVTGAAQLVKHLLLRCASLTIIVTSREPLHLTGETLVRVGPLAEAVELFRERAREIVVDRSAGAVVANAATVAEICRKLDGIPLAIELAAANVATISVEELLARLGKSMRSLVSRDPTREQRHRTLRAAIAWSYDLLDDAEATALRALATFAGTFDTAGAGAVIGTDREDAEDVIDGLALKSMVWVVGGSQPARYVLMTTVREYLRGIMDSEVSAAELARRHGFHYTERVEFRAEADGVGLNTWLAWIDSEIVNIRQSLDWAVDHDVVRAARTAVELSQYWKVRGFLAEGRGYLSRLCSLPMDDIGLRARLLRRAASFAIEQDDYERARELNLECRQLYESLRDADGVAETYFNVGLIEQKMGNVNLAFTEYDASIKAFRSAGNSYGEMVVSHNLAALFLSRNDLERAAQIIDEAEPAVHRASNEGLAAHFNALRGMLAIKRNDFAIAERFYREALSAQTHLGDRQAMAVIAGELSLSLAHLDRLSEASEMATLCLTIGTEIDSVTALVCGFEAFCEIGLELQQYAAAAQSYAQADVLRASLGYNSETMRDRVSTEAILRAQLGKHFDEILSEASLKGSVGSRKAAELIVGGRPEVSTL